MTNLFIITLILCGLAALGSAQAEDARIDVHADHVVGSVSRLLAGACIEDVNHEIYGGIYSQMIFGESFQEPPTSPVISDFKPFGGSWAAQDGMVHIDGLDGPKLVSQHAVFRDGAVGTEIRFADATGENAGLLVRVTGPGLGADNFTGYEVSLDPLRQTLRLARHRNNYEPIQDVHCDVAVGRWIPLEVRLDGPLIEVLVDGKSVLRHDDGPVALEAGTVGLRVWHREARYRNLWIRAGEKTESLAFNETNIAMAVSGMWRSVHRGSAQGGFTLIGENPFVGSQSQHVTFESGSGEWGIENEGLNRWGMSFVKGKPYEGYVWARAEKPTPLYVSLESRDGSQIYAEEGMTLPAGDWQKLPFRLNPKSTDRSGRFAITLKQPGSIFLGHAFLQPGEWGRFKGLPVRRDVAEALIAQGITVLRYGGSMVNHPDYRWKKMIGPRDRRPLYHGTWYPFSSNGWGILDFMDFCEAAGFEYIPDFNRGETPQDMADFVEYAVGPPDSEWGRKRVADGRREPYRLHYLELGNEERVDAGYFAQFKPIAEAIWAKDPGVTIVVGDFFYNNPISDPYHFDGGAVSTLAAHKQILDLAKAHNREVCFDVHIGTGSPPEPGDLAGPRSLMDQLGKLSPGAKFHVVIFEFNAGNHDQKRALSNALAINAISRDGRIPIGTSANCLQPDGQNDNDWDQGLLFLNPSEVWLQPPGYVTQMVSHNYLPDLLECSVSGGDGKLDVSAVRSSDGKTLALRVVNWEEKPVLAQINIAGFSPARPVAQVTELSGKPGAVNTAENPRSILPKSSKWNHHVKDSKTAYTFQPFSFTVIRLE